jgi:hypothetical protein
MQSINLESSPPLAALCMGANALPLFPVNNNWILSIPVSLKLFSFTICSNSTTAFTRPTCNNNSFKAVIIFGMDSCRFALRS